MSKGRGTAFTLVAVITMTLVAALTACHPPHPSERSKFFTISPDGWAYGDTLTWIPVDTVSADTSSIGALADTASIFVAMRHANDYPYANIWLECSYFAPEDTLPRVDTINIWLADEYGHWKGSGIGVAYQLSDTALRQVAIDLTRPVSLRHVMRVDKLTGVEQMGLIIK